MKRASFVVVAGLFVAAIVSRALAGITVTSYSTTALTNGFAPSLQGPYFAQQTLEDVTPALAEVSGDWIGPNADGTPDTWHFVGTSQANSTTTFDPDTYTVTAEASFQYTLDTTAAFVDPRPTVFSPGGAANYRGFFEIEAPATYFLTIQLSQNSGVSLGSFESGFLFNHFNASTIPVLLQLTATIPPAHYQILATTGVGVPNLPSGITHYVRAGGFQDFFFTVQVPEPGALGIGITIVLGLARGHARRAK